jgi:hypothetical protein
MPTDRAHLIAFAIAQGAVVLLGVAGYLYVRLTTPKKKPRDIQPSFDFSNPPSAPAPVKIKMPPMAGV